MYRINDNTASRVIGGEFAIDPAIETCKSRPVSSCEKNLNDIRKDSSFHKYYASGRTALFAILQSIHQSQTGKVLLPDFLCESITKTVIDSGMEYCFYHIHENLLPDECDLAVIDDTCSAILLINYFGLLDLSSTVAKIRSIHQETCIIVDDVQNLYSNARELDYNYAFTSFRKWLPVPDGAVVYAKNEASVDSLAEYTGKNTFAQYKYAGNLLKNYSRFIDEQIILGLIERGENELDMNYLCNISEISKDLLQVIDLDRIAVNRRQNAAVLHEGLKSAGIPHLYSENAVPLFVPVFLNTEQRTVVRKNLFAKNIFCPIHWPWRGKDISGENVLYETELSLICDQRYTIDDMKRIVEIVYEYFRN